MPLQLSVGSSVCYPIVSRGAELYLGRIQYDMIKKAHEAMNVTVERSPRSKVLLKNSAVDTM